MNSQSIRLFVDLDGTLAEWRQLHIDLSQYEDATSVHDVVSQIIRQPGYYRSLTPYKHVVEAIRYICQCMPQIEVYSLSCYPDNCNALAEKDEWIDKFIPEIDKEHRIFVPDGQPKKLYVPDKIRDNDFLLDDYTQNLLAWNPGQGIKLYNGLNGNNRTWKGNALNYNSNPTKLVNHLSDIILNNERIIHSRPQDQIETDERDL